MHPARPHAHAGRRGTLVQSKPRCLPALFAFASWYSALQVPVHSEKEKASGHPIASTPPHAYLFWLCSLVLMHPAGPNAQQEGGAPGADKGASMAVPLGRQQPRKQFAQPKP
eukprot:597588-Pelagomonas_calceolata.AAC.6